MPTAGDTFIITLKRPHLEWGTYRHTNSRGTIYGEGYLQIPIADARRIGIFNSNQHGTMTTFNCNSVDGFLTNVRLKASGSSTAGAVYAKQFQGDGDLRLVGNWFSHVNAQIGDRVRVTWTSPTDIEIELL